MIRPQAAREQHGSRVGRAAYSTAASKVESKFET